MPHLHPLRSEPMNATVLNMGRRDYANNSEDEIEVSVSIVVAMGEMLDRMQTQMEEQASKIIGYQEKVRELTMQKEAAYKELTNAETMIRVERERSERAERMVKQTSASEREAQEKIKRLVATVKSSFGRAENALAIAR